MYGDYLVWVRRMQDQRPAEQADKERQYLALRALVERDQGAAVAMRQRQHELEAAYAQRNQSDQSYFAQHRNWELGLLLRQGEAERAALARHLKKLDDERLAAFQQHQDAVAAEAGGRITQRRHEHLAVERSARQQAASRAGLRFGAPMASPSRPAGLFARAVLPGPVGQVSRSL